MICRCPEGWYLVLPKKGIKLFALLLFLSAASVSVKNNLMTLDSRTKATWQMVSVTPVGVENPKRYTAWLVELSPRRQWSCVCMVASPRCSWRQVKTHLCKAAVA
ncbi:hypothetical protein T07_13201 [Trichinella nelsoni]|uniref:Uncharacterized protein n=1 Tax=Trichinella nelsoni TaxID=6336 RepID=A0A0V0S7A3_9BILA|nr:hypothetical protein T07_13201 [Trichinella nelsoni]